MQSVYSTALAEWSWENVKFIVNVMSLFNEDPIVFV